jgi:hypothetical protein
MAGPELHASIDASATAARSNDLLPYRAQLIALLICDLPAITKTVATKVMK